MAAPQQCPAMMKDDARGEQQQIKNSKTLGVRGARRHSNYNGVVRTAILGKKRTFLGRVRASWPVVASQTFTVWSPLAEARRLPSGLKATLATPLVCPLRVTCPCCVCAFQ